MNQLSLSVGTMHGVNPSYHPISRPAVHISNATTFLRSLNQEIYDCSARLRLRDLTAGVLANAVV